MSNIDALVTNDLGAAAAANRDRLRTLDDTLRAVAPAQTVAVARTTTMSDLRMLSLADAYAGRVARAAAGAASLVSVVVVVLALRGWSSDVNSKVIRWFDVSPFDAAWRCGLVVLASYIVAGWWARTSFMRAVTEDVSSGDRLLHGVDRRSLALGIAGPFVFIMAFGIAYVVIGAQDLHAFPHSFEDDLWGRMDAPHVYSDRLRDLAVLLPLGIVAAIAIAFRAARWRPGASARLLESGWTVVSAGAILFITFWLGVQFDARPLSDRMAYYMEPNGHLRFALTISGSIGMFLALASFALWRRRRELQRIASASSSS